MVTVNSPSTPFIDSLIHITFIFQLVFVVLVLDLQLFFAVFRWQYPETGFTLR